MTDKAYIGLNEDNCWALYLGDGTEDEQIELAIGRLFEHGKAIREAIAELQQWAWDHGYELDAPYYSKNHDVWLEDVIEPEIFDEVLDMEEEEYYEE